MNKILLTILAVASAGLCSSFKIPIGMKAGSHPSVFKSFDPANKSFGFYSMTKFKATINGVSKAYDRYDAGTKDGSATIKSGMAEYIKINVEHAHGWSNYTHSGQGALIPNFVVTYDGKRLVSGTVRWNKQNFRQDFIMDGKTADDTTVHLDFTVALSY